MAGTGEMRCDRYVHAPTRLLQALTGWAALSASLYTQHCQSNCMKQTSSRFSGSCVIVGIVLSISMGAALELLRPGHNPLRNLLGEYLIGPFSFLGTAEAFMLAGTFLVLLVGLRLSVRGSGFLTAS